MAVVIKTALLALFSSILLFYSTAQMVKPLDVFAEANDYIDAVPAHVYISDHNGDKDHVDGAAAIDSKKTKNNKRRKQAGLILNILVIQIITQC